MNKKFIAYIALSSFFVAQGAITISGKAGTEGQPFPFTVKATAYDRRNSVLFIGSNQVITEQADKAQAISVVAADQTQVTGITPEKIKLNNVADQDNPLFGQQINFLALSGENPFAVTAAHNKQISFISNARSSSGRFVMQSAILKDANKAETNGIVGLTALPPVSTASGTAADGVRTILTGERFYAAVRPNGGLFGAAGSGIAYGVMRAENIGNTTKGKETVIWKYFLEQQLVYPLDNTSPALKIGAATVTIDNETADTSVVMQPFLRSGTVFTGLLVSWIGGVNDGARCITVNGSGLIAPDAAIETDSIVGGRGPNTQVSAHFLDTLFTSTQLDYLVMVGGVGDPATTKRSVYALPLTINGVLAKKTAVPVTKSFTNRLGTHFETRYFNELAQNAGDLYSPISADIYKARVGGTATLPSDIVAVYAEKDTVFVAVAAASANEQPGVFYSQALFDQLGRIQGFTDWQRAVGSTGGVFNVIFDAQRGTFWFFPGADANALTILKKTTFDFNFETIGQWEQALQEPFTSTKEGTQSIFDFNKNNPAFDQTPGNRISVVCGTGFTRVVLMESGADVGTLFTPTFGVNDTFVATNGTLDGFVAPVQKIDMIGGILNNIGPILAADIVSDGTYSWLVVGGSHGAAVLANPDGTGWQNLQKGFANLPATLAWQPLGDFKQVRKIIADNGKLYILTSTELVRIAASASAFSNPKAQHGVTLATTQHLFEASEFASTRGESSFSDLAISGKFGLLATSLGLLRVGNNRDISTAQNENSVGWQEVALRGSSGPITRLYVISPTGNQTEFATDERGGNIYVMNANVALSQTRVYRFTVQGLLGNAPITNTTLQIFNDMFEVGFPTMFFNRGSYRNYVTTDGSMVVLSRSAYYPFRISPFFEILNQDLRSGIRLGNINMAGIVVVGGLDTNGALTSYHVGPMLRRSATGEWLIAGTLLTVGA